jgi:hypothetical protein
MSHYTTDIDHLRLFLFTTDALLAKQAEQVGIDSIIVDWERIGKRERQMSYSTQINADTPEDVVALAEVISIPITVRINPLDNNTSDEIETALDSGASIIMLPMAKVPSEVDKFISLVNGRAKTLVQIETQTLVDNCEQIRELGWDYAYIGLNDLMISGQKSCIWDLLADATVEEIWFFGLCYGMDWGYKRCNPYLERHLAIFVNCFCSRANSSIKSLAREGFSQFMPPYRTITSNEEPEIFQILNNRIVGFGGVTRISGGNPIPFLELLHEMARLNCGLSVLRRTFKNEMSGRNLQAEIQAIRAAWVAARLRSREAVLADHLTFLKRLGAN